MILPKSTASFLVSLLWAFLVAAPTAAAATIQRPAAANREPPCTGSFNWLSPHLNPSDCVAAIGKLWKSDVARYGNHELEFVGARTRARTGLHPMLTPRRYTAGKSSPQRPKRNQATFAPMLTNHNPAGTCTVVIAMLDIFPLGDLPEPPRPPFTPTDITSFHDLYQAATSVQLNCVTWLKQAGYQQEGVTQSIAVLLMATGSYEERFIPRGVVLSDKPGGAVVMSNDTSSPSPVDTA
ncbi:MAG: hypothetical protein LQ346_008348 [Caloplaca aetnensis]|nr:MAG: hypothetical protein LQ346_008348 [Caloplaca aetnensis]